MARPRSRGILKSIFKKERWTGMLKTKNKKVFIGIIVVVLLLIIDQVTKFIIIQNNVNTMLLPNILELSYVQNTGGAFGVGGNNTMMFIISTIVIIGLIIRFIYLQKDAMDKITLYSLFVIIAGGLRKFNR